MDSIEELLGAPFDPALAQAAVSPLAERKTSEGGSSAAGGPSRQDRIQGMLLGVAVGDALGAPHEFANQVSLEKYTGRLEHPLWICRRFQGGKLTGNIGQITDDTEMMIALARSICLKEGHYDRDEAAKAYLAWANSRCTFMGNNTRALFVGVKTLKGYQSRWAGLRAQPQSKWSQSNGCLMRCAPLATLPNTEWGGAVAADCALTNFHPICIDAVRAYICAARELLAGATPAAATAQALVTAAEGEVVAAIASGRDQKARDVRPNKGWILHAIYCAFLALNGKEPSYQDRIDRVVRLGGDTDTNGAIAGALLGAHLGDTAMRAEARTGSNIITVLEYDAAKGGIPRPEKYAPGVLPGLADSLAVQT